MNLEKLFNNLSKILSEKENAKIEIKLIKKQEGEVVPTGKSIRTSKKCSVS